MVRRGLPYVLAVVAMGAGGAWLWLGSGTQAAAEREGFRVLCTAPECGHAFVIPRSEAQTWPRAEDGRGFRCARCGRFTAKDAKVCPQCGQWYLPAAGQGRSAMGCPRCPAPSAATTGR